MIKSFWNGISKTKVEFGLEMVGQLACGRGLTLFKGGTFPSLRMSRGGCSSPRNPIVFSSKFLSGPTFFFFWSVFIFYCSEKSTTENLNSKRKEKKKGSSALNSLLTFKICLEIFFFLPLFLLFVFF